VHLGAHAVTGRAALEEELAAWSTWVWVAAGAAACAVPVTAA